MAVGGGVGLLGAAAAPLLLTAGGGEVALCPREAREDEEVSALAALSGICPLTVGEEVAWLASASRMNGWLK